MLLRLPLEVRDLFREWLETNYPDRARHVFKLIRDMRGGKDYDSTWGKPHEGHRGPIAWMIGRRFELACEKLGLNTSKTALTTEHFQPVRQARRAAQPVLSAMQRPCSPSSRWASRDLRGERALLCGARFVRAKSAPPAMKSPSSTPAAPCWRFIRGSCWRRTRCCRPSRSPAAFRGVTVAWNCASAAGGGCGVCARACGRGKTAQAAGENRVGRLFRLFRRSGRPRLGGGARAGFAAHRRWPAAPARLEVTVYRPLSTGWNAQLNSPPAARRIAR